ncbi:MAG: Gfo/Idh/MocA family oxidoreductase [Candidatus Solibacter sp.]
METVSRRKFVALAGAPAMFVAQSGRAQSPNDKVVLALIGAGGRGSTLGGNLAKVENTEFKYICDVNDQRGLEVTKTIEAIRGVRPQRVIDMRRVFDDKDVDGVVVATPEHWHALATVWACQANKDVYVEKSPSLTVWEGRKMIEAAHKYKRVVQVGFENRSGPYSATARDYIKAGKLGKIRLVKVYNLLAGGGPWKEDPPSAVPPGVDWDLFQGPAPERPFTMTRLRRSWGTYWDYSGGELSDDASHQLDLARMALGDPPHPKAVYCTGGRFAYDDKRETPDLQAVTYDYGDFVMTCECGTNHPYMAKFSQEVRTGTKWPYWPQSSCRIEIFGSQRLMFLGRHGCGWQVFERDGKVVDQDKGYFPDKWHQPNFVECIRSRKAPNADIAICHYSACLVHLGNVAFRVGKRHLPFDGGKEQFLDAAANAYLKPAYRKQYRIPDVV